MKLPKEVLKAKKAYFDAYNQIKAKVRENARKYVGTKFEDCPPLIKEQGQFFVKRANLLAVKERLTAKYGEHPSTWDFWVTWYEKNSTKKNSVQTETPEA